MGGNRIYRALCIFVAIYAFEIFAATLYVKSTGDDAAGDGTSAKPFYSLSKATALVAAGDTIIVGGGVYAYKDMITLDKSGTQTSRICIFAQQGEKPVFNFSQQPYDAANRAILLKGNYWYIRGIEICYAGDNGIKLEGSNNRIESCTFHHNGDSGIQLGFGHEDPNPDGTLCAYNEIVNCDSYLNFDFDSKGGDADGFACKMHNGKGNVFTGCRSYRNSDDGFDLFETDWPVIIENCWTWHNGDKVLFDSIYKAKIGKAMSSFSGNGNGFKLGGNGTGGSSKGTHVVRRSVAFDNKFQSKKGFDQNSHKGGVTVHNCVSFGNGYNYMFEDSPDNGAVNEFKNNVTFNCAGSLDHEFASGTVFQNNSWDLTTIKVGPEDFRSIAEDLAVAPRKSDGSLPQNDFCKLVEGSDLIDKGVDVGLPFAGAAPDLGAFEFGLITAMPGKTVVDLHKGIEFSPIIQGNNLLVKLELKQRGEVAISFFDPQGRMVLDMGAKIYDSGIQTVLEPVTFAPSTVLFCMLRSHGYVAIKKLAYSR